MIEVHEYDGTCQECCQKDISELKQSLAQKEAEIAELRGVAEAAKVPCNCSRYLIIGKAREHRQGCHVLAAYRKLTSKEPK